MKIYSGLKKNSDSGKKMIAILVDPDRTGPEGCRRLAEKAAGSGVDFFFVGSSILTGNGFEACIDILKETTLPVLIFPGNQTQISLSADGILFLSLISGRNPDMLIGRHVLAAPFLKKTKLEIIPTGYILIDSGAPTSASYMSGTTPIPHDKDDIAVCTAMAGEMLGLKLMYLDAGSGARYPVSISMVEAVKKNIGVPLIVGGGIRTPEKAMDIVQAGADVVVIGNAIEKDQTLIAEMIATVHEFQSI